MKISKQGITLSRRDVNVLQILLMVYIVAIGVFGGFIIIDDVGAKEILVLTIITFTQIVAFISFMVLEFEKIK